MCTWSFLANSHFIVPEYRQSCGIDSVFHSRTLWLIGLAQAHLWASVKRFSWTLSLTAIFCLIFWQSVFRKSIMIIVCYSGSFTNSMTNYCLDCFKWRPTSAWMAKKNYFVKLSRCLRLPFLAIFDDWSDRLEALSERIHPYSFNVKIFSLLHLHLFPPFLYSFWRVSWLFIYEICFGPIVVVTAKVCWFS